MDRILYTVERNILEKADQRLGRRGIIADQSRPAEEVTEKEQAIGKQVDVSQMHSNCKNNIEANKGKRDRGEGVVKGSYVAFLEKSRLRIDETSYHRKTPAQTQNFFTSL